MTAPGWHYAQGDPPGTQRYWDGERWIGDPVPIPGQGGGQPPGPAGGYQGGGYQGAYGTQSRHPNLASVGSRIGARLIDFVILAVLALIFLFPLISDVIDVFDRVGTDAPQSVIEREVSDVVESYAGRLVLIGGVALLWDFLWVALLGGTPGKLMLGLRVARADNGAHPPGFGKAALRALNRLVGLIPALGGLIGFVIAIASFVMLLSDDENRTVMDRVASTVVVKK